jgi:hypothetical protein
MTSLLTSSTLLRQILTMQGYNIATADIPPCPVIPLVVFLSPTRRPVTATTPSMVGPTYV